MALPESCLGFVYVFLWPAPLARFGHLWSLSVFAQIALLVEVLLDGLLIIVLLLVVDPILVTLLLFHYVPLLDLVLVIVFF